jgi:hypothetical protein
MTVRTELQLGDPRLRMAAVTVADPQSPEVAAAVTSPTARPRRRSR